MPKAKQATEQFTTPYTPEAPKLTEPVLYDVRNPQTIPFAVTRGGKTFRVSHTVQPPSNERFFQLREAVEEALTRAKKVSSFVYDPHVELWKEIALSREGFKERDDWKEVTHPSDAVGVLNALFHITPLAEEEQDITNDDELLDDEALYVVAFHAQQGNTLLPNLTHSFRQESKAEMDEYLAIMSDQPNPNALASSEKMSKAERYYRLGKKLLRGHTGYAEGSEVPAWHLAFTVEVFLARQLGRMGKSLAA
jgi:hypothetical protein